MTAGPVACKEPKHLVLHHSASCLEKAIGNLIELVDKIEESDIVETPPNVKEKESPSLSSVLVGMPERLESFTARIRQTTDRLESLLF